MKTFPHNHVYYYFLYVLLLEQHEPRCELVGRCSAFTVMLGALSLQHDRERGGFQFVFISQRACMAPRCSGLKKQKADASVIKTIKPAAAPSAIVRDRK